LLLEVVVLREGLDLLNEGSRIALEGAIRDVTAA
jgi:hypothetical protein